MALVRQQQLLSFTAGLAVVGVSYVSTQVITCVQAQTCRCKDTHGMNVTLCKDGVDASICDDAILYFTPRACVVEVGLVLNISAC